MAADLGPRIAQLRLDHGLSQEALANKLGVSRQAVSRWECGETLPDTENLIALADLFEVSLDELARQKGDGFSDGSDIPAAIETDTSEASEEPAEAQTPKEDESESEEKPRHRTGRAVIAAIGVFCLFCALAWLSKRFIGYYGADPDMTVEFENALRDPNSHADIDGSQIKGISIASSAGQIYLEVFDDDVAGGNARVFELFGENGTEIEAPTWSLRNGILSVEPGHGRAADANSQIYVFVPERIMPVLDEVSIEVGSGQAMAQDVRCDSMRVEVASGSAHLQHVEADSIDASCGSGYIFVDGTAAHELAVQLDCGSGDVVVADAEHMPASIAASVGTGSVALHLPKDCGFTLAMPGQSQRIDMGFDVTYTGEKAVFGNGGTDIAVSTDGGLVSILPE